MVPRQWRRTLPLLWTGEDMLQVIVEKDERVGLDLILEQLTTRIVGHGRSHRGHPGVDTISLRVRVRHGCGVLTTWVAIAGVLKG